MGTRCGDVVAVIELGGVAGFVAPHSLATVHYLLTKWQGREVAKQRIPDLLRIVIVAPLDHDSVLRALALGWSDFEDALQTVCAQNADAELVVTRDLHGFGGSPVPPISPEELLALIRTKDEFPTSGLGE